jgi:hypothetical protein
VLPAELQGVEVAEKVGKKVIKKLCELEWERFKDTGTPQFLIFSLPHLQAWATSTSGSTRAAM